MDTIEAIKSRISTRVYKEDSIENNVLAEIKKVITKSVPFYKDAKHKIFLVEDSTHSKSLFKGIIGSYGKLVSAGCCLVAVADDTKEDWISVGFAQEQVVIELTKLGLSTCWVGGFFDNKRAKNDFGTKDNQIVTDIISIGYSKPHFLNTSVRALINGNKRKPKEQIAFHKNWGDNCDKFLNNCKEVDLAVQMAILSPSASNKQPVRVIVNDNDAHFYTVHNSDLYTKMRLLDAGIFMSHFYMTLNSQGIKAQTSFGHIHPLCAEGFVYAGTISW